MEIILKLMAIVETCALVFGLIFATKGIKAKDNAQERKTHYRRAGIYIGVFLLLNILGMYLS
jgi:hypothetical protein